MSALREMKNSPHKDNIRSHFDRLADDRTRWIARNRAYYGDDRKYTQFLIPEGSRVLEVGCATGELLAALKPSYGVGLDFSEKMVEIARRNHPELTFVVADAEEDDVFSRLEGTFDYIVLSDTVGYLDDIERVFRAIRQISAPHTRLVVSYYSHLWEPVLALAEAVGQRCRNPTWSSTDITNLLYIAGFEVVRTEWRQLIPKRLLGLGSLVNRYIGTLPLIRRLSLRHYVVAAHSVDSPTISLPCQSSSRAGTRKVTLSLRLPGCAIR